MTSKTELESATDRPNWLRAAHFSPSAVRRVATPLAAAAVDSSPLVSPAPFCLVPMLAHLGEGRTVRRGLFFLAVRGLQ